MGPPMYSPPASGSDKHSLEARIKAQRSRIFEEYLVNNALAGVFLGGALLTGEKALLDIMAGCALYGLVRGAYKLSALRDEEMK